jgi:hypothetical protein
VDFDRPAKEDSAQHQREDAPRMRLRVRQRQRRPPGAAEDQPSVYPQVLAQALQIGDQVPCRIVCQLAKRCRLPTAALVVHDDAIERGIEKSPVIG